MNRALLDQHNQFLAANLENKRILISGATGLIGSRVVAYLDWLNREKNANIEVVALYRDEQKRRRVFAQLDGEGQVRFVQGDVERELSFAGNVDYIIHCAGYSGGTKMHLKDPVKVFETGIGGTRHLLDFAVNHRCEGFLYVSTYEVYGDASQEGYITERQACQLDTFTLRNCYAEIKRLCESMLCAYSAKFGLPVFAVRLTSTFGTGVKYDDPRFFAEFARCIIEGRDIVLKSPGRTVRSYLDADDAAIAFLYVLTKGESCNAYNLTNMGNEISIRAIAERMIALSRAPVHLAMDVQEDIESLGMRREGRTVMDATKMRNLGWEPVYSLDDTILKLIESMRRSKTD